MTLRERFEKLEPRERRLLGILGAIVASFLVLGGPIALFLHTSQRRAENQELRELIESVHAARTQIAERKSKHDALVARYARKAPALAGFIEDAAKANGISAAESQDKPVVPHGKRYDERITVVKIRKVNLLPLLKTLERIEQSAYPVAITRLNIKPRAGEPDTYEVELGVSAFDRKADEKKASDKGDKSPEGAAAPSAPTDGDDL